MWVNVVSVNRVDETRILGEESLTVSRQNMGGLISCEAEITLSHRG